MESNVASKGVIDARSGDMPYDLYGWDRSGSDRHALEKAVELRLAELDRCGVAMQVLCAPRALVKSCGNDRDRLRHCNSALKEMVDISCGRLAALALLDLDDGEFGAAAFQQAMEHGFHGVAVPTSYSGKRIDDAEFQPLLSFAARHRKPVFIYSEGLGDGGPQIDQRQQENVGVSVDLAICLARLIFRGHFEQLPELLVFLDQGGGAAPSLISRWDHGYRVRRECQALIPHPPSRYLNNVFFDASTLDNAALTAAINSIGPQQIVFASAERSLDGELDRARRTFGESDSENQALLYTQNNAARLYGGGKSL
ncbi:amidohydrolase family protein [Glaciimonas sp. PCH181]|uniref:amidohydrolase family protein n=1 Tax=Glaciimonas sp. PCH181 TaxID=2133943 RepID=UPI001374A7D2|nr:amidohydrolase family protein [Glaciimonas sp. PCH181]